MRKLNDPIFVKVLDSTCIPSDATRAMIGEVCQLKENVNRLNLVYGVYTPKKDDWHAFHLSDLQLMTPAFYKGERIGVGDTITDGKYDGVVQDWYMFDERIVIIYKSQVAGTLECEESEITSHTPLHPTKRETIEIGGLIYDKAEVEKGLKGIKPVK